MSAKLSVTWFPTQLFELDNCAAPFIKDAVSVDTDPPTGVDKATTIPVRLTPSVLGLVTLNCTTLTPLAPGIWVVFGGTPAALATVSTGGVAVGVKLGVNVGVKVRVSVGVGVGVKLGVKVKVSVGVGVGVKVSVDVNVFVGVKLGVKVEVKVGVSVGVGVGVKVGVKVEVKVGVAVGFAIVTTAPVTGAPDTKIGFNEVCPPPATSPLAWTAVV